MKRFFVFSAVVVAAFLAIGADARAESGAESRTGVSVPPKDKGEGKAATEGKIAKKGGKIASPAKEEGPKELHWTWKRDIKGVQLGNLAMPWNGDTVFFTMTAPTSMKTDKKEGDVIAAVAADSHIRGEMGGDINVKSLYSDGAGKQLMAETKDGKFFTWPEWEKSGNPKAAAVDFPAGTVPTQTLKTAIFIDKEKKEATVYREDGKKLRSYPLASIPASVPAAWSPFFKDEEFVLIISAEGEVTYYNRESKLWKVSLGAPVTAVSSSYMQNELLAFGTGNAILFVDGKTGTFKGKAEFKSEKLQLDCTQDGSFCAAIGYDAKSPRLAAFSTDGKELWSHPLNAKPRRDFLKLQALAKGSKVIAGLEEKGGPEIEAFGEKGETLWKAPIADIALDYRVSWGADGIAVLYKDFVTYYNLKPDTSPKVTPPLHNLTPPLKPGEKPKHKKKSGSKQETKPASKLREQEK